MTNGGLLRICSAPLLFRFAAIDSPNSKTISASRVILNGHVQGLGVRPAIVQLARQLALAGSVRNTARGVEIVVEGAAENVDAFVARLPKSLPRGAVVERLVREMAPVAGRSEFAIEIADDDGPIAARVPADMVVCPECLAEIRNDNDRRFEYPFTSCTACGPRFTIIRKMPYERPDTTMSAFVFCEPCRREYETPGDRRFHAQTNACPDCGPQVWCSDRHRTRLDEGAQALSRAVRAIDHGQIVALRGIGGYQLLVDATDEQAVARLRQRKRRRGKPLAVMVRSVEEARRWALIDGDEQAALQHRANPIVLVRARGDRPLAASVHPGMDTVGLMLPSSPLHALIADRVNGPVVCTSGNSEGDPLEHEVERATRRLADIADLWLHHDRPIERPLDDSVVRVIAGRMVTIRLARGMAPMPLPLELTRPALAVGGHLKNAIAWGNGIQTLLGPHLGDLDGLAVRQRFADHEQDMRALYRFTPEMVVHDAHPDYFTSWWAESQHLPRMAIQHHAAHVAAGMLEHQWLDQRVLGLAWDGTGYGSDGAVWGGEFLVVGPGGTERVGHVLPFHLPGGDQAVRQPWRVALSLTCQISGPDAVMKMRWPAAVKDQAERVLQVWDRASFSPRSTSMGRLFDAAACVILGVMEGQFEGQPAMMLEAVADQSCEGTYSFDVIDQYPIQWDWRPLWRDLLADTARGSPPPEMAAKFHRTIARAAVHMINRWNSMPVVLSGGVFQNRLLTELIKSEWGSRDERLGLPGGIPPNDGGLAAGQLAFALIQKENRPCV